MGEKLLALKKFGKTKFWSKNLFESRHFWAEWFWVKRHEGYFDLVLDHVLKVIHEVELENVLKVALHEKAEKKPLVHPWCWY